MTGFFQQAPPLNSLQKRFIESIVHKHNVVGSFPLAYPTPSLYAFAALMGSGLAVVVCPDKLATARMGRYFAKLQYAFPDVAVLDGMQMPHEERETYEAINRNKVRLLLTTPERFNTLNFLNMMVHANVSFVLVEQAQMLLPDFSGNNRYQKLVEAMDRLQQQPPMVLLSHPLPAERQVAMKAVLGIKEADTFEESPLWDRTTISLVRCVTEHQKAKTLLKAVKKADTASAQTGPMIVIAADARSVEAVARLLENARYGDVRTLQPGMAFEERASTEAWFAQAENPLLITTEYAAPVFRGGSIFYWQPPASVASFTGQIFAAHIELDPAVQVTLLYTKEDHQFQLSRWRRLSESSPEEAQARVLALKRYRQWVLSQSCRRQTLAAYLSDRILAEVTPCGVCDRCVQKPKNVLQRLIEQLFV